MSSNPGFELHGLQKLFATYVTTARTPRCFIDPVLIQELVIGEVARIKLRLIESSCAIKSEEAARKYVQIHQYAIVAIMDKLFQRRDQPGALECCDVIDGLLSSIREHFPRYFDELGKAPLKHIHELQTHVRLRLEWLETKLLSFASFGQFAYMIIDPLKRFCSKDEGQGVTFHRLRFLSYILQHSKKTIQDRQDPDDGDLIMLDLMLYLNYNSRKSYLQLVSFFRDILNTDLPIQTKRDAMFLYLNTTMQASLKPNTGHHPHAPTLKTQLIDYFNGELRQLDLEAQRVQSDLSVPEQVITNKIKIDLSVAQLAFLLRLLTDTGVISTENISELLRWVALHCETKQSKSISVESLRIKFYDIEDGTRGAVQEKLVDLSKLARTLPA